ncbi:uncharacterized protein UTRI_06747 [Ustilago trichophora]|uniref:Uncharacterized protein n=1 Tax=Ustilago trichophora TaxID=86804 RepID=A0A5C3EP70_9BASI|nr:uncharacterized protein UTRI_06747 [Ustilago trichophora]
MGNPFASQREGIKPSSRSSDAHKDKDRSLSTSSPSANIFQRSSIHAHINKDAARQALSSPFFSSSTSTSTSTSSKQPQPHPTSSRLDYSKLVLAPPDKPSPSSQKPPQPPAKLVLAPTKVPPSSGLPPQPRPKLVLAPTKVPQPHQPFQPLPPSSDDEDHALTTSQANPEVEQDSEEADATYEVDELSEEDEDEEDEEDATSSNPKGRTPKVDVKFPCSQCMISGKTCELHVSKKSMKCLRCFTKGYGPCRVVKEPLQELPPFSSARTTSKDASAKAVSKKKKPCQPHQPLSHDQPSSHTEVQGNPPPTETSSVGSSKHKRARHRLSEGGEVEEVAQPLEGMGSEDGQEVLPPQLWQAFDRLRHIHTFISDPQLRQTLLFLDTELEGLLNLVNSST